jgi:hypothetical protein
MESLVLPKSTDNNLIEFFENVVVNRGLLSQDDIKAYRDGQKVLKTTDLFIRKKIDINGIVEVIDENDVEFQSRCNLSKGRVPSEKNIICAAIQLKYGFSTPNVNPELVDFTNCIYSIGVLANDPGGTGGTVYARRVPLNLINAEFKASVDDVIFDEGRASQFFAENVSNYAVDANSQNNRVLLLPKFLKADKTLRFSLKFPQNAPAIAGNHYVEIAYRGLELTKRS